MIPMSEQTRTLYLMRHASAEPYGMLGDRNRSLTTAGREEAAFVGGQLADSGIEHVVVSSAARTRQTVAMLGLMVDVEKTDRLYGAGSGTVLDIARELDPTLTTALIVGHAPGVPTLIHLLASEDSDLDALALVSTHFPTGTCCRLEFTGPWTGLVSARLTQTIRTHLPRG